MFTGYESNVNVLQEISGHHKNSGNSGEGVVWRCVQGFHVGNNHPPTSQNIGFTVA